MDTTYESQIIYHAQNYSGCRIVITDVLGQKQYGETVVDEHNVDLNVVRITGLHTDFLRGVNRVAATVYTKKGRFYYMGTVRRAQPGRSVEIALYKGEKRESRRHPRYPLGVQARVLQVWNNGQSVALQAPIPVVALNISVSGLLLAARPQTLTLGMLLQVVLDVDREGMLLRCYVVRSRNVDKAQEEYGCRLVKN